MNYASSTANHSLFRMITNYLSEISFENNDNFPFSLNYILTARVDWDCYTNIENNK